MDALIPQPRPHLCAASPNAAVEVRTSVPADASAPDRDTLLRDLARALGQAAARQAWVAACLEQPDSQEPQP